jgi:cytochrome oxidase Cu insertion factor (SCO1/SenC/PrrC family)
MRSRIWTAAIVGFVLLAPACTARETSSSTAQTPIAVGDSAPPFTLESANDGPVSLSDYAGKPVLLYFSMGPG